LNDGSDTEGNAVADGGGFCGEEALGVTLGAPPSTRGRTPRWPMTQYPAARSNTIAVATAIENLDLRSL
jgi:hypothetical protein